MFKLNKLIYLYKDLYYIFYNSNYYIFYKKKKIIILPLTNIIYYYSFFFIMPFCIYYKNIFFYLKYLIYSWHNFIVYKIRFRYKGSWVYINKLYFLTLILEFGLSHRVKIYLYNLKVIRKKKLLDADSLIFWGVNIYQINYILNLIYFIRKYNQYTFRGIRFSKQKYYKRIGKISKYTMFKSKIF